MILVINAGSSSIKFQLYRKQKNNNIFDVICKGVAERINIDGKLIIFYKNEKKIINKKFINHSEAIKFIFENFKILKIIKKNEDIKGIGNRIVHGGENFSDSVIINNKVLSEIKKMIPLAPLHNPPAIDVIEYLRNYINVPNVAVFDTSFHTTIPLENFIYSVPYDWYLKYKLRRYGFHGISYRYILEKISFIFNKKKENINTIICHLGNGASICGIKNGKSYNTTMGLTPLEGLIMGTRSGDIDPSIHEYMSKKLDKNINEITYILNNESGLLGISGISSDSRDILFNSKNKNCDDNIYNNRSSLALKMFAKRVAKYIISYINEINNKIDCIVFTAGIGENSPEIRELIIKELNLLNLILDEKENNENIIFEKLISKKNSNIPIYVIRTDEEIIICKDTYKLI